MVRCFSGGIPGIRDEGLDDLCTTAAEQILQLMIDFPLGCIYAEYSAGYRDDKYQQGSH